MLQDHGKLISASAEALEATGIPRPIQQGWCMSSALQRPAVAFALAFSFASPLDLLLALALAVAFSSPPPPCTILLKKYSTNFETLLEKIIKMIKK
jgi:hypothetical protein